MTVSDIFGQDCRGTVFDPPCPSSFVGGELTCTGNARYSATFRVSFRLAIMYFDRADSKVVGNLLIQADPLFGGGAVNAGGEHG